MSQLKNPFENPFVTFDQLSNKLMPPPKTVLSY